MTYQGWEIEETVEGFVATDPNDESRKVTDDNLWDLYQTIDAITGYVPPVRVMVLVEHLGVDPNDVDELDNNLFHADGGDYLVYTDDEADEQAEDAIHETIDDCVLPEIPECYHPYFDREQYVQDMITNEGRGPSLATDGYEHEITINGEDFYIYRAN
jgi:hypothetical protein